MKTIRILSRDSALAVRQAQLVMEAIARGDPAIRLALHTMKTEGDRALDKSLDAIGGKGLFVRELDAALLSGKGDLSVHSYKDMPAGENPALPVVAVSAREDARDALVLPEGAEKLDLSKPVGCSSARRAVQLRLLFPGITIAPLRGNVPTRLKKLDAGEFGALVLAAAGLRRLGLGDRISRVFEPEEMLPAACQGIIAAQGRAGEDFACLRLFHDETAALCAKTERAFLAALGADCFSPVAVYARPEGARVNIGAMFVGKNGAPRFARAAVNAADAAAAAEELAGRFLRDA